MVNTQLKILRVFGPTGAEVSSVLRGIRDDGCPGLRLLERDGEFAICVQVSAPNRAMAEQYCDKWAARLRAKFGDDVFAEGETSLAQATLDALLEKLNTLPARSIVLLHPCCHNPTGADLTPAQWDAVVEVLKARAPVAAPAQLATSGAVNDIHTSPYTKEAPLTATLSVNQKITGRNSEKDVRHIEIDLGDSGLRYQPGDALGVWYQNDPQLVKELVELLWLKGDEPVTVDGKTLPLAARLTSACRSSTIPVRHWHWTAPPSVLRPR